MLDNLKRRRRESNNFSNSFRPSDRGAESSNNRNSRRRKEKNNNEPSTTGSAREAAKEGKKRKDDAEESYDLEQYRQSPIDGFFKFIEEIGSQVGAHRSFWKRLPYVMCGDVNVEKNRSAPCWNGNAMSRWVKLRNSKSPVFLFCTGKQIRYRWIGTCWITHTTRLP